MSTEIKSIGSWQLCFVRDCNLRCRYCATGFGRYGNDRQVMDRTTWERFCELALSLRDSLDSLYLHFSGGETFLHFDAFADCMRFWKSRCVDEGVDSRISVCTNGVLLDDDRLEICADLDLELTFSIDGSGAVHDAQRLDSRGRPTHESALRNWRRYREMLAERDTKGACAVQSVINDQGSLSETIGFWMNQDLNLFDALVVEPSRYTRSCTATEWSAGRRRYLEDFKSFADSQASRLGYPDFLSDYRGPSTLYSMWSKLFVDRPTGAFCRPAITMLAVDAAGVIYPCEGFFGMPAWSIGDVRSGLCATKRKAFVDELIRVRSGCADCSVRDLCGGGCVAADPERGLLRNYEGGCDFISEVIDIAKSSYRRLSQRHD